MKKKILLALSLITILTVLFAIAVSAADLVETWDISATETDSVIANLYNDESNEGYYTLTVSGKGNMKSWSFYNAPWYSSYGSKIKSVVIGDGVTNIGGCAFYYCTSVENITISDSVTDLGENSLEHCTSLKSIVIPDGVKTVNNWAIKYCTGLESVTIPESVTSIGEAAFYNCTALTEINFNATSLANFESGNNVFYNAGKNGSGITVTIGKNVTKIPERLFCPDSYDATYSPKIINVIFEENSVCTSIARSAFNRCGSLTSINLPSSVTSIGMYAFLYCSSLKSITIPKNTTSIANEAFNGCTALTEIYFDATALADLATGNSVFYNAGKNGNGITVTIGKNVTKIPARLLCPNSDVTTYSPKVTKVIFEENSQCTSIGQSAFNQCCYLTSINLPNTVTSIGPWAFQSNRALTSIRIPESVTSIDGSVFHNCSSLKNITIPEGVTNIGGSAFKNCTSLQSITIPKKVKSIGNDAFYNCTALTKINFKATLMAGLGNQNNVFYNAGKNENGITVTVYENVTKIPMYIFSPVSTSTNNSPKITKVIFEGNSQCKSIGESAFNQCCYLTYINIPNTVTSIGRRAFQSNYALKRLVIPKNVTSMGNAIFINNDAITIYAEVSSKPSGWDSDWNYHDRPVVWNYKNTIKNDIFTFKGYSTNELGSIAIGFEMDYSAKALYEELTGSTLEIGVVFAGYENLNGNQPLDNECNEIALEQGVVIKSDLSQYSYTSYDFLLVDIEDSIKDIAFVISAYIYDGEIVKYTQENGLAATVNGISYNEAKEKTV
ncbi:MAG: leucine-rich repeat domain-containing protein [Clostridia bacterium]|nr:leucine-rich repeat domain-containing protein [Clostridia bacterium]